MRCPYRQADEGRDRIEVERHRAGSSAARPRVVASVPLAPTATANPTPGAKASAARSRALPFLHRSAPACI
jgi:hypothetical protein